MNEELENICKEVVETLKELQDGTENDVYWTMRLQSNHQGKRYQLDVRNTKEAGDSNVQV